MRLYLVQHGDAVSKEENPDRPLSTKGRDDAARLARLLGTAGVRVDTVFHSGKRRAWETAEILAAAVTLGARPEPAPFPLAPKDPVDGLVEAASRLTGDAMAVGHLPFMARAVSVLLGADADTALAAFQPGTLVCLERMDKGWAVVAMLRPDFVPG